VPIQTSCPSCQRPLRVPDDLIGKAVKCPGCATVWTVDAEAPVEPPREEPPLPPEEQSTLAIRESLPASDGAQPSGEEPPQAPPESVSGPPALPPPPDDLEDDEDDPEYYERLDERRRERLKRNYREDAKSKVMGPAIGLIVTAAITLLSALLNVGYGVFQIAIFSSMPRGPGAAPPPTGVMATMGGIYGLMALFYAVMGGIMLFGALQMMKLRRYGVAMASCILAIIPCQGCCYVTGIPFGIWGLVVLLDPKVKAAFTGMHRSAGPAE
jgi:predicted Zn finger-like uncharacterized protein